MEAKELLIPPTVSKEVGVRESSIKPNKMNKIFKYSIVDLLKSRWTYLYFGFFLVFTLALLMLSNDIGKVIISLLNVILVLCPLIATMFGVMYYYNSREFIELLLAQPIQRTSIFMGQYLGLAVSLSFSLALGIGLPFLLYGLLGTVEIWNFFSLIWIGVALTFIFSAFAFWIALKNENRIKGFGLALVFWLFFAIVYDGLFLLIMILFKEYPLENVALVAIISNPIDLARVMILLKLDISALMGYTGAVFQKFLGSNVGIITASAILMAWIIFPLFGIRNLANKKDF